MCKCNEQSEAQDLMPRFPSSLKKSWGGWVGGGEGHVPPWPPHPTSSTDGIGGI